MLKVVPFEKPKRFLNASSVSDKLNIAPSTLRTYTSVFRQYGHVFIKQKRSVLYSEDDLQLLRQMLQLHQDGFGTIQECVASVCAKKQNALNDSGKSDVYNKDSPLTLKSLQDAMDDMNKRYEQLQQYVDTKISKRDEALLQVIREIQAQKEQIQNKKRWWQFWRK